MPYNIESQVYLEAIGAFPDGATVALFNVDSEFGE